MKRLSIVFASLILLASAGLPNVVLANRGGCQTFPPANFLVGNAIHVQSSVSDITAGMDVPDSYYDFGACADVSHSTADGVSAWIALDPDPLINNAAIIQVGITVCYQVGEDACKGNLVAPRFFYALGGCGANGNPIGHDLGPADRWSHTYTIQSGWQNGLRWFGFWIDGVSRGPSIWGNDDRISCWAQNNLAGNIYGEAWDNGDSLGTLPSATQNTWGVNYQIIDSGSWIPPIWPVGPCAAAQSGHHYCRTTGSSAMQTYSVN